jgi:deferrochelatase/peroxidase EfeB
MSGKCPLGFISRRAFFKSAGGGIGLLAASTGLGALTSKVAEAASESSPDVEAHHSKNTVIPFWDKHQAGIVTPQQGHSYFVSFDLITKKREEVIQLLKDWTQASALLTEGKAVKLRDKKTTSAGDGDDSYGTGQSTADSGESKGLSPSRLTLTFGFGPGLFVTKDKVDRYGLAKLRPEALADLPKFHGDELVEANSGGDLSIQACSDDPQVAFHAVRQLARFATDVAQIRWAQSGFLSVGEGKETPRNLMGFKDGTQQPKTSERDTFVWVGDSASAWMRGGSYLVTRRIRIALEHWDGTEVDFQEQVIGRHKDSGAPLGQKHEREVLNLSASDKDGNPVIPGNAHIRLATAASNGGAQMLRRGYSYNDGVNFTAERWPPWRQGMEYDAGLFFLAYQSDPRTAFTKVFQNMAKLDALNQFVTHVGSGLFACPPGVKKGEYIGQKLFEAEVPV